MSHIVKSEAELEALYGQPAGAAVIKEIDHISDHYRSFIDASPFVVLATAGPEGLDCTPRGDPAGFVRVVDRHTILLADRRGNNRLDTLRNIVRDPRIALLFLIPGIGRTLRINGRAVIDADPDLCASFTMEAKAPIIQDAILSYAHQLTPAQIAEPDQIALKAGFAKAIAAKVPGFPVDGVLIPQLDTGDTPTGADR